MELGRLQATTVAHRLLRLVGRRGGVGSRAPLGAPEGGGSTAPAAVPVTLPAIGTAARRADAPVDRPADRRVEGPALARVLDRARAAGAPPGTVRALADRWAALGPAERRGVDRPLGDGRPGPVPTTLRVGGAPARQTDATTCGSAVLAMLAAAGDPVLALWLTTGDLLPGYLPPELRTMSAAEVTSRDAAVRLSGLQHAIKRASTRRALGPLPWPAALGTPPWGAARVARYPGVGWTHVLVDDTDTDLVDAVLRRADAALAAGVPVPLFTGGDLGGGPAAAVPRHVVLLVPGADRTAYAVYEPGHGRVHRVERSEMVRPGGPRPAFGGWSHVCWALLPQPRAGRPGPAAPGS